MQLVECWACRTGTHHEHVEILQHPLEGGVGGVKCPCRGECRSKERARTQLQREESLHVRSHANI